MQRAEADTAHISSTEPPRVPAETTQGTRLLSGQPLKGIGLLCLAYVFFSANDAMAKYMVVAGQLPVMQVTWVRFMGQFLAILAALGLFAVPDLLRASKPGWQLTRSCFLLGSTVFNFFALRTLRLDQVTTLQFMTPLLVALAAGPLLGEWVGWRRMVAILVGFVGIVVALRPSADSFDPNFFFSIASVFFYTAFSLSTRHLAAHDKVTVTLFYSMLAGVVLMAPFALAEWRWPATNETWAAMASIGIFAAIGHAIFITAFRYAPASTLMPFTYFGLLTSTAAGFLVFNQMPDLQTLAGAVIVVASGLYLLHRERVRGTQSRNTLKEC